MKFVTEASITGGRKYNDTVDGVKHDFTKIYIDTELSKESGFGTASAEYKWGTHENILKIQDIPTPFKAKVTMEIVTNGNKQMTIVHDVVPISPPKGQP